MITRSAQATRSYLADALKSDPGPKGNAYGHDARTAIWTTRDGELETELERYDTDINPATDTTCHLMKQTADIGRVATTACFVNTAIMFFPRRFNGNAFNGSIIYRVRMPRPNQRSDQKPFWQVLERFPAYSRRDVPWLVVSYRSC
jgi:hypothetical protein